MCQESKGRASNAGSASGVILDVYAAVYGTPENSPFECACAVSLTRTNKEQAAT